VRGSPSRSVVAAAVAVASTRVAPAAPSSSRYRLLPLRARGIRHARARSIFYVEARARRIVSSATSVRAAASDDGATATRDGARGDDGAGAAAPR